ncbi:MAG: collagenase [Planctomycetota bacterium]|jgi:hypothetical protein
MPARSLPLLILVVSSIHATALSGQQPPAGAAEAISAPPPCSLAASAREPAESEAPAASSGDLRARVAARAAAQTSGAGSGIGTSFVGPPCSAGEFALLQGVALVDAIAAASDACLGSLWSFDADVAQVIAGGTVVLVADRITALAVDTVANAEALRRLAYFYQIAFYHEFYEGTVSYDGATEQAAIGAMVTLGTSLDLTPPAVSDLALIEQWGISMDSTNATIALLPQCEAVLARYNGDPTLSVSWDERIIVYRVLFSLARQIGNNCGDGAASPWYLAMPGTLLDEVGTIALDTGYTDDDRYLVENALWAVSRCSCLAMATSAAAHAIVSDAYQLHAQNSAPWLRAVIDLESRFGGVLSDGTPIDIDAIRDQVRATALPNEFRFDQGRLIFRTAIDADLALAMYEAMQEVESQFFRQCTELTPVPGDDHEVLTLVIYGSPDDYQTYQPFLYGLSTNNGGIFIESWGTLFTYDRTPQQSIYTLEELLRHEYVHYLDSRHLITGSFGEAGTLYEGNRLVWYNEGLAEFLAGSTRSQGVLPRGILLEQIDGDATRLSIDDVIGTGYGSFTFYRYAGMLFSFLESERPDLLLELFQTVRGNDIAALDALYASLESDPALQAQYDAHLTARIAEHASGTGTFAEEVPTTPTPANLPVGGEGDLRLALDLLTGAPAAQFRVWPDRFRYTFAATTPAAGLSLDAVRGQLDAELDISLLALEGQEPHFGSTVAWCGELEPVLPAVESVRIFEGPYRPDPADATAPPAPTGLIATTASGVASLQWDPVLVDDLSGYQVGRSASPGGPYEMLNAIPVWEEHLDDPGAGTGTWFYVVHAIDAAGNLSGPSGEVMVETVVEVLVVNGYFDGGNTGYYQAVRNTLDALGVVHNAWDPFVDGPVTAALLAAHPVVIWPCGYLHGNYPDQLGPARRQLLQDHLDAGGSLLLSGAYVSTILGGTSLFTDHLHVSHLQWGMELPSLIGEPGSAVGASSTLTLGGSAGYRSEIALTPPAEVAFRYDASSGPTPLLGGGVAASTVDAGYRTLFLAFPFTDLVSDARSELLAVALPWLNPGDPCPQPFVRGDGNGDGMVDVADVVYLLAALFTGGPPAVVAEAAFVNGDAAFDISDPIYLLAHLFSGGPPPAAPFPAAGCP